MSTQKLGLFSGLEAAGNAEVKLNNGKRGCYRCHDCLTVLYVDSPEPWKGLVCGACDGRLEWLGFVGRSGLYKTYTDAVCDLRCTNARGPSCDCSCKGENHGSRLTVVVVVNAGQPPKATPYGADKARMIAEQYRAARDAARARLDARFAAVFDEKARGYIPPDRFNLYLAGRRWYSLLWEAEKAKTISGRLKKLESIRPDA